MVKNTKRLCYVVIVRKASRNYSMHIPKKMDTHIQGEQGRPKRIFSAPFGYFIFVMVKIDLLFILYHIKQLDFKSTMVASPVQFSKSCK